MWRALWIIWATASLEGIGLESRRWKHISVLHDAKIRCTTDGKTSDKWSRLSENLFSFIAFKSNLAFLRLCMRPIRFIKKKTLSTSDKGMGIGVRYYNIEPKISQDRQIFIFSFQFFWVVPSQMVPLINQQRSPDENSQAGQPCFCSGEHFFTSQHGFCFLLFRSNLDTRKKIWRSTWVGTVRHPCS